MHRTPRTHRASCPIVRAKRALTLVNNCSCFRLDAFDGCPNQFAYADNFYQIACWRAKTARWAKHRLAEAAASAAAAAVEDAVAAEMATEHAADEASTTQMQWVAAAACGVPNATYRVNAAATTHRLATAAAATASKLAASARTAASAAQLLAESAVLSAEAATASASSAAASQRLAEAAAKAASASAASAGPATAGQQALLSSTSSLATSAVASFTTSVVAATAASNAIAPPSAAEEIDGHRLSPAAAAAIAASPSLDGIVRMAIKLVEHHGKGGCDGNSNTPVLALKHAIEHQLMGPNPGTRQLVLFLAEHKPFTSTPKSGKRGWEAIGRIFYGFMNTDLFTKAVVADADGRKFKDSTKHHSFVGRQENAQVFTTGELQACHEFCPCSECLLGRYASCRLRAEMGAMHRVAVPWLSGPSLHQLAELAAWGELLKSGMVVAFTADPEDATTWPMEGNYYLAQIEGPAFPVPESQVHASDQFEAGWLVVKARWFEIVTTSPRCYKLQTVERTLVVSEMIRLPNIKFNKVVKRSPRLGTHSSFYARTPTTQSSRVCASCVPSSRSRS